MRDDVVSVVGGGWSVSQVDLAAIPGTIIGVNESAFRLPRCDIAVTMDRLFTEHRWKDFRSAQRPSHIRRSALQNLQEKWPWLNSFECDHSSFEFSDQRGVLNGTNSGLCAFNLAYQMRPGKIYLFGFDMKRGPSGQPYWHPPYPWRLTGATSSGKYAVWSKQFRSAASSCARSGIEVAVVGDSAIDAFPKISTSEFVKVAA